MNVLSHNAHDGTRQRFDLRNCVLLRLVFHPSQCPEALPPFLTPRPTMPPIHDARAIKTTITLNKEYIDNDGRTNVPEASLVPVRQPLLFVSVARSRPVSKYICAASSRGTNPATKAHYLRTEQSAGTNAYKRSGPNITSFCTANNVLLGLFGHVVNVKRQAAPLRSVFLKWTSNSRDSPWSHRPSRRRPIHLGDNDGDSPSEGHPVVKTRRRLLEQSVNPCVYRN